MFDRNLDPDTFERWGDPIKFERCTGKEQAKAIVQMVVVFIALVITFIICLDLFGLIAWVLSGQVPQDGFYIGRITTEIIKFIISLIK